MHSFLFSPFPAYAQGKYTQVIRGSVMDKNTQQPLPGANILVVDSDPLHGTASDSKGEFILKEVPVGRQSLIISFLGYKSLTIPGIDVTSGKEVILTIELEETMLQIPEAIIRAESRKDLPINKMVTISAYSFNVEETERYAGSVGDPSRMASSFAGVTTLGDERNEIVIRGNSPMGLQWRLDGADIPNPNHFGSLATTGGGISMINNNLLSKSDFFTGGFPAEYGNALCGVFDLNLRNGNNQRYEFLTQVGFNGLELGVEGPLPYPAHSSFIINYRYSMLMLVDKILGTDIFALTAVPYYHDLSFKFDFPGTRLGRFSLTGIFGVSGITENDSEKDSADWSYLYQGSDYTFGSRMGALILSHTFSFNEKNRIENHITFSSVNSFIEEDTLTVMHPVPAPQRRQHAWEHTIQFSSVFHKKINSVNFLEAGANYRLIYYSFFDETPDQSGNLTPLINMEGIYGFLKSYIQLQHKFTDELVINGGFNALLFIYNMRFALDPRLSMKWSFRENQSLSFGTGIFSQLPERMFYLVETEMEDGTMIMTNKYTGYMRSLHAIVGYDLLINKNLRLKTEAYYQYLFNIPVRAPEPGFSMLNFGSDYLTSLPIIDSLENKGTGRNYGIEITVEHFLEKGFYFLVTSSLFESKYKGYDGILRNTAFNTNFAVNVLVGKEFTIRKKNFLNVDFKITWAGGVRYLPYHTQKVTDHYYIRVDDWENAYAERRPDYFRINLRIGYKVNFAKASAELALDLLNVTNHENVYFEMYDPTTGEIKTFYQFPFLPIGLVRVMF
jgi:hypothetical protein